MNMNDVEKLNMTVLLCINFITLLKNSHALDALTFAQRKFRQEVRQRLDDFSSSDL